jgi:hypothetical protein
MLAYSGKYRIDGHKIVITVDVAWDEAWNGTEQVRHFRLDGDELHIEAAPQSYANLGGKMMRGVLTWARAAPAQAAAPAQGSAPPRERKRLGVIQGAANVLD